MKSPFPGMDPYIEECGLFEDFHSDLISEIKHALAKTLPDRYIVRTGERAYVVLSESEGKETHAFLPDVSVHSPSNGANQPTVAFAEPLTETDSIEMRAFISTEYRESFLEIYVREPERMLVTSIEVLSPSNKRRNSVGWDVYMRKRQGLLLGEANFVEIDLLQHGDRLPMLDAWPNSPYTLLVSRRARAPYCQVWPAHYRLPLPKVPIPLLSPDADVTLELQPMVDAIYARSRYARDIDYAKPLSKPMNAEESAWFAERLRQHSQS